MTGLDLHGGHRLIDQWTQVHAGHAQVHDTALELGDQVEVLHDLGESVHAVGGPFQEVAVHLLILQSALQERQDVALDVEDRRLQLVGQVADELPTELLALVELADLRPSLGGPCRHFGVHFVQDIGLPRLFHLLDATALQIVNGAIEHLDAGVDEALDAEGERAISHAEQHAGGHDGHPGLVAVPDRRGPDGHQHPTDHGHHQGSQHTDLSRRKLTHGLFESVPAPGILPVRFKDRRLPAGVAVHRKAD
jgi:hypothetical protein